MADNQNVAFQNTTFMFHLNLNMAPVSLVNGPIITRSIDHLQRALEEAKRWVEYVPLHAEVFELPDNVLFLACLTCYKRWFRILTTMHLTTTSSVYGYIQVSRAHQTCNGHCYKSRELPARRAHSHIRADAMLHEISKQIQRQMAEWYRRDRIHSPCTVVHTRFCIQLIEGCTCSQNQTYSPGDTLCSGRPVTKCIRDIPGK